MQNDLELDEYEATLLQVSELVHQAHELLYHYKFKELAIRLEGFSRALGAEFARQYFEID